MRTVEELLSSALVVIDQAFTIGAWKMLPLLSGGHDSLSACYVASQHPKFNRVVYHIDTGIGSKKTREFVEEVCRDEKWELRVLKASDYRTKDSYEFIVRRIGFPGPSKHIMAYSRLKERCIERLTKGMGRKHPWFALITGCRSQESVRRMGHVQPIKVGDVDKKTGKIRHRSRIWVAPCHDWSAEEQNLFMDSFGLPRNPVKTSPLGMSGECFCGAFARPGELEMIRQICPDVAEEIDRLAEVAKSAGTPCIWGERPRKNLEMLETGPLCSSCDQRARAAGIVIKD